MNYEDKYNKTIESIKRIYEQADSFGKELMEKEFPELRESEDERIRKELIEFIRHGNCVFDSLEQKNRFWAWLEKQGEQKSSWSEEDEANMDAVWGACGHIYGVKYQSILGDWLKSLKDRVQLQSKQEWSKEDENIRQDIISGLKAQIQSIYAHDEQGKAQMNNRIDWLKSLKPQNHWKPTEKQLNAIIVADTLYYAGHLSEWVDNQHKQLKSLYNDLKKLL